MTLSFGPKRRSCDQDPDPRRSSCLTPWLVTLVADDVSLEFVCALLKAEVHVHLEGSHIADDIE